MFRRSILQPLEQWRTRPRRKPLILRGARQTGKTKAVEAFSRQFPHSIVLNLEQYEDRQLFAGHTTLRETLSAIEVLKRTPLVPGKTLLFLDEIQNSPEAMRQLRYFHEQHPALHVVAAGSLLEAVLQKEGFPFPVGRVEFLYLYPATFDEFLAAIGETSLLDYLLGVTLRTKIPDALHAQAVKRFREYLIVGGMPEVVAHYAAVGGGVALSNLKESLLTAFEEDIHKYARTAQIPYLQRILHTTPLYVGQRITYEHFGQSEFRSREVKRAFELLEYAMIAQRIFGSPTTAIPIHPNFRVAPKLLYLDTGLVAHRLKLESADPQHVHWHPTIQGAVMEQVVGQELLALTATRRDVPCYWYRSAPSTAEVDYCIQWDQIVLPIEVKSGTSGQLRSLQQFMRASEHPYAIRVGFEKLHQDRVRHENASFTLLNLPPYLLFRLPQLLQRWVR